MRLANVKVLLPIIAALFLDVGCTAGLGVVADDGEITSYSFLAANNPALSNDVVAVIQGAAITATVPQGTDLSSLVADYVATPSDVNVVVGSNAQVSGSTTNDFSAPVTYNVSVEFSGSARDYTVFVSDSGGGDTPLTGVFVSAVTGSDTTGDGSQDAPFATIAKGITEAESEGLAVRVGQGIYTVSDSIEIVDGVSLYGGYDESDWSRDITEHVTEIRDGRTEVDPAATVMTTIVADGTISSTTIIDGFTIVGPNVPGAVNLVGTMSTINDASPTISNNIITGPTNSKRVLAMYLMRSSPVISNNTIDGGITDLTDDNSQSFGIICILASPLIKNNTISGGTSRQSSGTLLLSNSGGIVEGNVIDGGESGATTAVALMQNSFTAVFNNTIDAGESEQDSLGLGIDASSPVIENNTINGGGGGTGIATGIELIGPDMDAYIINNIVFTVSGDTTRCVHEFNDTDPQPAGLFNNDFFDCDVLYHKAVAPVEDFLLSEAGLANMEAYLVAIGSVATDNLIESLLLTSEFRIVGGPASVTQGGYDLSDPTLPLIAVPTDKDGEPRSDYYSMGAYQY